MKYKNTNVPNYKHSRTKRFDIYKDAKLNDVTGVNVEASVATNRLDVAETLTTELTPEEEEMFKRAAAASIEDEAHLKKRWKQFWIMMGIMILILAAYFFVAITESMGLQ